MKPNFTHQRAQAGFAMLLLGALLSACGGGGGGPRVRDEAQSLAFEAAPALVAEGRAAVRARASSGLVVSYASLSENICSVDAAGLVTALAGGRCRIAASQAGNEQWAPAATATLEIEVSARPQSVSFEPPPPLVAGMTLRLKAQASSGLPLQYRSLTPELCSIDAGSGELSAGSGGDCVVLAEQGGSSVWAAASARLTLAAARQPQTLQLASPPALSVGEQLSLRASASSGLAPSYSSLTPEICALSSPGAELSALRWGTCTLALDQAGDARWAPAPQLRLNLAISGRAQSLQFAAAPQLRIGGTATVLATASSGLPVSYSSLSPAACTVQAASGLVQSLAAASCVIGAEQAGDARWAPAPQQRLTLTPGAATQSISFGAAPALSVGGSATVRAVASSGLAISYSSLSPAICAVDAGGRLSGLAVGSCRIAADQAGSAVWQPATQQVQLIAVAPDPRQTLSFAAAPALTLGGTASVRAQASSGLPVSYSSQTPGICSVHASSGLVSSLSLGDCIIAADQAGNASYHAAAQVRQTLATLQGGSLPGRPEGVKATLGSSMRNVQLSLSSVDSGGSAITAYVVESTPPGISAVSATPNISVICPVSCAGYAFSVAARNGRGLGEASAPVDVLSNFRVITTFREPDTQPRDSIFTGSFTLNSTTGVISGASGRLTESMTGQAAGSAPYYDMTQVSLGHQLLSWRDAALGGRFVGVFAKGNTSTFTTLAGGDGWSPQAGVANGGIYAGFPAAYAGTVQNSSVLFFVPDDPFMPLSQAQLNMLAYADCAPGGMMGAVCMTGTSAAGYGAVGTMSGYPLSQTLERR